MSGTTVDLPTIPDEMFRELAAVVGADPVYLDRAKADEFKSAVAHGAENSWTPAKFAGYLTPGGMERLMRGGALSSHRLDAARTSC
jgi:hypothetical protein